MTTSRAAFARGWDSTKVELRMSCREIRKMDSILGARNILLKGTIVAVLCMLNFSAAAQMQLIEVEEVQLSRSSTGVVIDPSGATIPHVTIEERSDDWKMVLRTTQSDEEGRFHFSRHRNRIVHLEFSYPGFNLLRIRVRVDKKGEAKLVVKMTIAT